MSLQDSSSSDFLDKIYIDKRNDLAALVPSNVQSVLDVGCAEGHLGAALKRQGVQYVVGVEQNKVMAAAARNRLDAVYVMDIEQQPWPFSNERFDCVIFGDVLEHLINPWQTLLAVRSVINTGGIVIISIPNLRFWAVLKGLAVYGRWNYTEWGILDSGHLRFFTLNSLRRLLWWCGFQITDIHRQTIYPHRFGILRFAATTPAKEFFVYRYFIVARLDRLNANRGSWWVKGGS